MKKLLSRVLIMCLSILLAAGCCCIKGKGSKCRRSKCNAVSSTTAKMCGCGYVKGSSKCCDPKAKKCAKCGKIKGSPGCCK